MADRRMFSKTIIDSDAFIDMPVTARLLYFDLGMRADDDGFVNSPKKIMRMIGASEDDLRILVGRKFLIPFDSGVVVIKHWRIHNYIRKDMYHETIYKDEKALLELDENHAYVTNPSQIRDDSVTIPLQVCAESVPSSSTQDRLGKDRLGKDRKGKVSKAFVPPTLAEVQAYCHEINSGIDAQYFIDYYIARGWKLKSGPMKDWKATVRTWNRNGYSTQQKQQSQSDYFLSQIGVQNDEGRNSKIVSSYDSDISESPF